MPKFNLLFGDCHLPSCHASSKPLQSLGKHRTLTFCRTPDGSDSDIRETSSDGADSDSDQSESAAVLLELDRGSFRGAIGGGTGSTRSSHDALSVCSGSAGSMYLEEESPRHHSSRGPWGNQNVCPDRQQGNKLFEYAENAPPFLRVPLADKVRPQQLWLFRLFCAYVQYSKLVVATPLF